MKLTEYIVVAMPFEYSDVTTTIPMTGIDEEDALKQFRKMYPQYRVKEIKEQ
jgi:hypothetical protein